MCEDKIVLNDEIWEALNDVGVYEEVCEGEPFVVIESHEQVSKANQIINSLANPGVWEEWYQVYDACAILFGGWENRYSGLRLGKFDVVAMIGDRYTYEKLVEKNNSSGIFSLEKSAIHLLSNTQRATPFYSVPHYTVPEGLIELEDVIEWGFNDEYVHCSGCHTILGTTLQYHGWKPSHWYLPDDGYICEECLDPDEYIEHHINNSNSAVNTWLVDPDEHGWVELAMRFDNGFHHGMDADPKKIMSLLKEYDIDALFTYDTSQFYISFYVWVKDGDVELATDILDSNDTDLPYSIAEETSRALREASHKLRGG